MLNIENFEKLLLKNWTHFIDYKKLISLIALNFSFPTQITQVKLSRFQLYEHGFIIWVEFIIQKDHCNIVGTSEFSMNFLGEFTHQTTFTKEM